MRLPLSRPRPDQGRARGAQGTDRTEPHDPLKAAVWQALLPFMDELAQTGGVTFMGLRNAVVAAVRQGGGAGRSEKGEPLERVRHVKRGAEYEVLGEAEVQIATRCTCPDGPGNGVLPNSAIIREARPGYYAGDLLTVYRCVETGKLWCRFTDEFRDGRFVPASPAQSPSTSEEEG